jgi:hypothetical protein
MVPETPPLCDHVWTGTQIKISPALPQGQLRNSAHGVSESGVHLLSGARVGRGVEMCGLGVGDGGAWGMQGGRVRGPRAWSTSGNGPAYNSCFRVAARPVGIE